MVKHNQTIRRQQPTDCLSVFDNFVGLALKRLITLHSTLTYVMLYSNITLVVEIIFVIVINTLWSWCYFWVLREASHCTMHKISHTCGIRHEPVCKSEKPKGMRRRWEFLKTVVKSIEKFHSTWKVTWIRQQR